MNTPQPKKSLTIHYCLHQASFHVASTGIGAFAVAYLMSKGFAASQTGVVLALTNILSCFLQPVLGSYVDRRSPAVLLRLILSLLSVALISLSSIEILCPPTFFVGVLFVAGSLTFSLPISLSNTLCAHYAQRGYRIDYGKGAGVGSLSFSFASLGVGYIIALLGARAMIGVVVLFIALQMILVMGYPRFKNEPAPDAPEIRMRPAASLSVFGFFIRYRFFMMTLVGVMCLAACHTMAENFMINLFERIGGGSENVGTALFIACTTAAPALLFFEKMQKRTGVERLMRLSGVFFVLKALLLIQASSVGSIYAIELLQMVTHGFVYPCLYYYARKRIASTDMAKGQTIASALYTLGAAMGNSLGGTVIDLMGLNAMLLLAAGLAAAGTLLINLFVSRPERA